VLCFLSIATKHKAGPVGRVMAAVSASRPAQQNDYLFEMFDGSHKPQRFETGMSVFGDDNVVMHGNAQHLARSCDHFGHVYVGA
jgi:hypothetical protein